jgi:hypothetical protein
MKNILTLIFLLICSSIFGQVKFKLFGYDPCSKEVRRIESFGLKMGDRSFNPTDTSSLLLDSGVYILSYVIEKIDSSQLGKKYYIKSIGVFGDTLRLLSISPCIEPTTSPNFSGYCCCNKKCEGRQIDYYQNGNKRIEGNFIDGKPVGRLIFYHLNGNVREVHKYSRKGRLRSKTVS